MENTYKIKPVKWYNPLKSGSVKEFHSDHNVFGGYKIEATGDSEKPDIEISYLFAGFSNLLRSIPKGFMTIEQAKQVCQDHFEELVCKYLTPA